MNAKHWFKRGDKNWLRNFVESRDYIYTIAK